MAQSALQKKQAIDSEDFNLAITIKKQEKDLLLAFTDRKKCLLQNLTDQPPIIAKEDIIIVVAQKTKIPLADLQLSRLNLLRKIQQEIKKEVIGQDQAIDKIITHLRRSYSGLTDTDRPLGSFLFLGPSGVGKTYTAKKLAERVFKDAEAFIRIDMSEFSDKFNASKLIGAPAGYVGYKEQGKLTDAIRRRPYSVVLFDEIEKAHPDVFDLLLPVLDDGLLTDATGKQINFKNTIIIMTSNIGLKEFNQQASWGFEIADKNQQKKLDEQFARLMSKITQGLQDTFRPEFLNRLDKVIVFKPLNQKAALEIAKLQIQQLVERLKAQGFELKLKNEVYKLIAEKGYDPDQGARGIRKAVQELLESPLAQNLLADKFKDKKTVNAKQEKDKIVFV